jgi:hypothetical protein
MKWGKEKKQHNDKRAASLHKCVVVTTTALLEKVTASRALDINVESTSP